MAAKPKLSKHLGRPKYAVGEVLAIHSDDYIVTEYNTGRISMRPVTVVSSLWDEADKAYKYTITYVEPSWTPGAPTQRSGVLESILFRKEDIMAADEGTTFSRVIDEALNFDETEEAANAARLNLNSKQKLGKIHKLLVAVETRLVALEDKLTDPEEAARRSGAILAKLREPTGGEADGELYEA